MRVVATCLLAVGALGIVLAVALGFVPPEDPTCGSLFDHPTQGMNAFVCGSAYAGFTVAVYAIGAIALVLVVVGIVLATSARRITR